MRTFSETFGGQSRVLLPVVHVETLDQALRNVEVARDAGADGVFLIAHGESYPVLLDITARVIEQHPGWFVGVNCLDLRPHEVIAHLPAGVQGIWSDNAGVVPGEPPAAAERFAAERARCGWAGLHFGGVAFKYQRQVGTAAEAARAAVGHMEVICTSGPGTGQAMSADKAREMRDAVGAYPIALASGVTCGNVAEFLPYVDAYLVATGISRSHTELDPPLVRELARLIHAYAP